MLITCSAGTFNNLFLNKTQNKNKPEVAIKGPTTSQPEVSAEKGHKIAENNGCLTCHSTDGTKRVGPTWKGLYGRKVILQNDSMVIANSKYIKESMLHPKAKIAKGYSPAMPSFKNLSDIKIKCIIAYIKSISIKQLSGNKNIKTR